jgi:hypothetical protein
MTDGFDYAQVNRSSQAVETLFGQTSRAMLTDFRRCSLGLPIAGLIGAAKKPCCLFQTGTLPSARRSLCIVTDKKNLKLREVYFTHINVQK